MTLESNASVGDNIVTQNANWNFSGEAVKTFDDHIRRSVPMYETGQELVCKLSDFFIQDDSTVYEIGVSTGRLLEKLIQHNELKEDVKWVGLDSSKDMVAQAKKNLPVSPNISVEAADAVLYDFDKTDFLVSYYCVQFIPPKLRQRLFDNIYNSLNWGGAFVLFEKVRGCDARFQDLMTTLYVDFKLENNYSPEEIIAKTRSLKGRLEPFSTQGNIDLLKRAGFQDIITVFKYLCFEGFLAIK